MKSLLGNLSSTRTAIVATFIAAGAALTVSALFAQQFPRNACKPWADNLKNDTTGKKEKLRHAFVTALRISAENTTEGRALRTQLRASSNSARDAILAIFAADHNPPIFNVNFPPKSYFAFYERERGIDGTKRPVKIKATREARSNPHAQEHCIHIFYLPEVGLFPTGLDDRALFELYNQCCYEPW